MEYPVLHKIPPFIVIFPQSYLFRTVHAVALGLVVGLHVGMVMGVVGRTHIGNTMVTVNEKMLTMGAAGSFVVDCMDNNYMVK